MGKIYNYFAWFDRLMEQEPEEEYNFTDMMWRLVVGPLFIPTAYLVKSWEWLDLHIKAKRTIADKNNGEKKK